jgi:hypothetical protein
MPAKHGRYGLHRGWRTGTRIRRPGPCPRLGRPSRGRRPRPAAATPPRHPRADLRWTGSAAAGAARAGIAAAGASRAAGLTAPAAAAATATAASSADSSTDGGTGLRGLSRVRGTHAQRDQGNVENRASAQQPLPIPDTTCGVCALPTVCVWPSRCVWSPRCVCGVCVVCAPSARCVPSSRQGGTPAFAAVANETAQLVYSTARAGQGRGSWIALGCH